MSPSASASPTLAAPTDNYDVSIFNAGGIDVLQGVGLNRDIATSERAQIVFSGTTVHPTIDTTDDLTLVIEGNLVASAQMTIDLWYALGA